MHMDREQESYVHSRRAVESTIEDLISLLDALDEDPDLEPNGDEEPDSDDEPSLGRPDAVVNQTVSPGGTDDWELDRADSEPSLASPERHPSCYFGFGYSTVTDTRSSQLHWADGNVTDLEENVDDEGEPDEDAEPDNDDEPSLGALNWASRREIVERDAKGRALRVVVQDGSQLGWGSSGCNDLEAGEDGQEEEPDGDGEFLGGDRYGADEVVKGLNSYRP